MGEAKQRKATDPLYGKNVPKLRGLIISSPTIVENGGVQINGGLDAQDLRSSLLYWDRLSWPQIKFFNNTPNNDEIYLLNAGILYKPELTFVGSAQIGEFFKAAPLLAIEQYEKTEPGVWSLGSGINSTIIKDTNNETQNGALLQLYNAVPVPSSNVPLNEILEFKHRRRSELLTFRMHFENLATEIQGSSDSVDMLNSKLKEVDQACADLVKVTKEWQVPLRLSNVNAAFNLDLPKALGGAARAWTAAEVLGLQSTGAALSAIAAGIQSQFKLSADIGLRSIKKKRSPYRYAYLVQRDLN